MVWYLPFHAQPVEGEDNVYEPSPFMLMIATKSKTDYKPLEYTDNSKKYQGTKPILVVCTDEYKMPMANGKIFSTGNHPIEMFVPMLHFRDAGFTFEIATEHGDPVCLEMWAYPTKDESVKAFHESLKSQMEKPKKLSDISSSMDGYAGIFIPGGHGCMINLPSSEALGKLLHAAHAKAMPTITLCHGPATLLASAKVKGNETFAYKDYEAMCFTDTTDGLTPYLGYLPGTMPWKCQASIVERGMKVLNSTETGAVHQCKELISGDSPFAANSLGKMATPILVQYATDHDS